MRIILYIFVTLFLTIQGYTQTVVPDKNFSTNRWGLINIENGDTVVPYQALYVRSYKDSVWEIKHDNRTSLVTSSKVFIVKKKRFNALNGNLICIKGPKDLVLNFKGDTVIGPIYQTVNWDFNLGCLKVRDNELSKEALFNSEGVLFFPFLYNNIESYESTKNIIVSGYNKENRKRKGVVTLLNDTIVPIKYGDILFHENKLIGVNGKHFLPYDTLGLPLLHDFFKNAVLGNSNNGLFTFERNKIWGVVNLDGKVVIEPKYNSLSSPSKGYIPAKLNYKWGLVNSHDSICLPFEYENLYFVDGLLTGEKTGKIYLYDSMLNKLGEYEKVGRLFYGARRINQNGKQGLIDSLGTEIISCEYDALETRTYGVIAKRNYKWGLLDYNGSIKIEFYYDYLESFDKNGYSIFMKNSRFGIVSLEGVEVIPPTYEKLTLPNGGFCSALQNGSQIIINLKNEMVYKH